MKSLLSTSLLALCTLSMHAQSIISVAPSSGIIGQELDLTIQGFGSNFSNNSIVDLGPDITITHVTAINEESIIAHLSIDINATPGIRDLTVTTQNESITQQASFELIQAGNNLQAVLEVLPSQSIRLSDFDPTNPINNPILFKVSIFNDQVTRDLLVRFTLMGDQYGLVGTAEKEYRDVQPLQVLQFNNRDFDQYNLNTDNEQLMRLALRNATLPADQYEYLIEVLDLNGNPLVDQRGFNTILNLVTPPELISPGNEFDYAPQVITTPVPLFQWFSQSTSSDINIYPVFPGQLTPEEVVVNQPVYSQTNITGSTFLYPASAEQLQPGQTYAWQISSSVMGSGGEELLPSQVFWFSMEENATLNTPISRIELTPDTLQLAINQGYAFQLNAYNEDNQLVQITPDWKVIPADAGSIDRQGVFTAGNCATVAAVVAQYAGITEFATVHITLGSLEAMEGTHVFDFDRLVKELFGLP